jgi:hypothetical protein
MTLDEFWNLLEGLPIASAADELKKRLQKLDPAPIAAYQNHFDRLHNQAYDWLLWGAAYIIDGGCSDDGFIDFRYGLISRGRQFYEAALANPDSLADVGSTKDEAFIPNEDFGYVALEVYEAKTGNEMPREKTAQPSAPTGENWNFNDEALCAQMVPRLWARFGSQ